MTTIDRLKECLRERRAHPKRSAEWDYLTRTAWTLLQIARGVPANEWREYQ